MSRLICFLALFTAVCDDVQCQNLRNTYSRSVQPVRTVNAAVNPQQVSEINRRVAILEREVVGLKRKNTALENTFRQMNATLFSLAAAFNANHQAKIANLTVRMDDMEASIATIVDQTGIDLEDTELNSFLGNAEAQLVDVQIDPAFETADAPTIPPEIEDFEVDQADLLGNALFALNKQNEKLSSQVAALQQEVERDDSTSSSARKPETDMLENRINQLERLVVSQTATSNRRGSTSGHMPGVAGVMSVSSAGHVSQAEQTAPLTAEEQETLRSILLDTRGGAVSMFSFARTGSFMGTRGVPHSIPYEVQLSSKGVVFEGRNGTFICQIPGYYFITFTARTFDHKYLGINLMKNGDSLTAVFSDKHGRNVMQTQSIIVHLAAGDHLWLRMPPSDKFGMHSDKYHMSTFTGFLLYQGDP